MIHDVYVLFRLFCGPTRLRSLLDSPKTGSQIRMLLRSRAAISRGRVVRCSFPLRFSILCIKQRGAGSEGHQRVVLCGRHPPPAHGDFDLRFRTPAHGERLSAALRPTTTGSGSYCPRAIREGLPIIRIATCRSAGAAPRSALTTPHERALCRAGTPAL
jgi:hypothetical protein